MDYLDLQTAYKETAGTICSFDGGYELKNNILTLNEKATFGKRIYDAKDWPQFREAGDCTELIH